MLNIKNYVRAQSLDEAYELCRSKNNRVLGGMLWLKMSDSYVDTAIDLCDLGLDKIEEDDENFYIGAMVSLRQIEKHRGLNKYTNNALAAAVQDIVGVQFRNIATVGGSIFGRFGFSDVLTIFLSLNCFVQLHKGGIIPLEEFSASKRERDILVKLILRKDHCKVSYRAMRNSRTDLPVLTCAVSCINDEYRAVIGARPERAVIVRDENNILSEGITEKTAKAFAEYIAENVPTGSNIRGTSAYRTHLAKVLTERGLTEIGGSDNGNKN